MKIEHHIANALPASGLAQGAAVVVAMPAIHMAHAQRSAELMARRSGGVENAVLLIVEDTEREGYVAVCNRVFRATDSAFFAYVAQDAFAGRGWLRIALNHMAKTGKGLLAFNDGKWHGQMAAFGLVLRSWALMQYGGDLFYAQYRQHFADVELSNLAKKQEMLCFSSRSILIEVDWGKDGRLANRKDKAIFNKRLNHFEMAHAE